MHSFEVHSNESACRKKVRLGLEQVRYGADNSARDFMFCLNAVHGISNDGIDGLATCFS